MQQLNQGEIETVNLTEWLAVDQRCLLAAFLQQHQRTHYLQPVLDAIDQLKKQTVNTINEAIGMSLYTQSVSAQDTALITLLSEHTADIIRCWAAYMTAKNPHTDIKDTLQQIQRFAADHHFGVREISWLSVRSKIITHLDQSIHLLAQWTAHPDANIRRFASESTRPRGVWCEQIKTLVRSPEKALPLLTPLQSDPARYVQDSVGNWLNDASKSQPDFVIHLCRQWASDSPTKATQYIIKKAMRTIRS